MFVLSETGHKLNLLCLNACRFDDRPPPLDLRPLQGPKRLRCELLRWQKLLPELDEPLADRLIGERIADGAVELDDNIRGRALRGPRRRQFDM